MTRPLTKAQWGDILDGLDALIEAASDAIRDADMGTTERTENEAYVESLNETVQTVLEHQAEASE